MASLKMSAICIIMTVSLMGCATVPLPELGVYHQSIELHVVEDCGKGISGWHRKTGEGKAIICMERVEGWQWIWDEEYRHFAVNTFGWLQPESHTGKVKLPD